VDRRSRLAAADDVIENSASEPELEDEVARLHHQYLEEAARVASKRPGMKE
jgi:dephospho-CoA kinase